MTRLRLKLLTAACGLLSLGLVACSGKANATDAKPADTKEPVTPKPAAPEPAKATDSPVSTNATANAQTWVKLEGQVVWPKAAELPKPAPVAVTADKEHCLSKGPITSDEIVVDPKTRGLKNVWVYLRPANKEKDAKLDVKEIHPDLQKPAAKVHEVDQPCCMFVPRILALRSGDFINFKNSSPVPHNTKLDADEPSPSFNKTIAAGGNYQDPKPFVAQRQPIIFSCSIHPWMSGRFMVFDHPYFAVTDAEGKFTIPNCPAGDYHLVYRHEAGYHKGKEGVYGWPVKIKDNGKGVMVLEPVEFEAPK